MLLGFSGHMGSRYSARDSIHNYYEQMVIDQLLRSNDRALQDADFLADATCVALNHLPPRYIRHDVDMTFFLSPMELEEMTDKVARAVNDAVDYVLKREQQKHLEEATQEPKTIKTSTRKAKNKR